MHKQPGYAQATGNEIWSGEATRRSGFAAEETRVDINIAGSGTAGNALQESQRKERPVWMVESTIVTNDTQVLDLFFCLFIFIKTLSFNIHSYTLFRMIAITLQMLY